MDKSSIRIVFMGTPEFASTCLKALCDDGYNVVLVVCQPDKPVGRKHIITPPPSKVTAGEYGIEVFQPVSMKTQESYDRIKACDPDLIVTAAYGKILPQSVLDIPTYGPLNVHGSLLPVYRGAAPVQYSILNGDKVTGVTIMKMDAGMDTGDILAKVEVPIDENIHTDALMALLAEEGSKLLLSMIPDQIEGRIKPVKQDEERAVMSPPIRSEQGEFTWDMDALVIHNKIRALSSWPGAYVLSGGKKLKIYDSRSLTDEEIDGASEAVPGTVLVAHKSDLVVKCGNGCLKILELQTEGGKRLRAADCAHNYRTGIPIG